MDYATAVKAIGEVSGGRFVGLDTETPVTLTGGKKNPLQGRVTKRVTGSNVMCFSNQETNAYEAMVRRRMTAEGLDATDFVLGERAWGSRIPGTPFVQHTKDGVTKYYLEAIFMKAGKVEYFVDGVLTDVAEIQGLPVAKPGEQGGLENKVIIRSYTVDNIINIR